MIFLIIPIFWFNYILTAFTLSAILGIEAALIIMISIVMNFIALVLAGVLLLCKTFFIKLMISFLSILLCYFIWPEMYFFIFITFILIWIFYLELFYIKKRIISKRTK